MRTWIPLLSAVVLSAAAAASLQDATDATDATVAAEPTLADLAWLEGHWISDRDGVVQEEWWTAPRAGLMLGLHRDVRRAQGHESLSGFEYLRLQVTETGIAFLASPGGREATSFPLVKLDGREAVFEKPDHDFPQRIVYRREGDVLHARAEDLAGEKGLQFRWERRE